MEAGDLSKPAKVDAALRALSVRSRGKIINGGKCDQGHHTHEVRDIVFDVAQLLTLLDEDEEATVWEENEEGNL